jgi:hypothetical protein
MIVLHFHPLRVDRLRVSKCISYQTVKHYCAVPHSNITQCQLLHFTLLHGLFQYWQNEAIVLTRTILASFLSFTFRYTDHS